MPRGLDTEKPLMKNLRKNLIEILEVSELDMG
jgi:hypothetical protein